LDGNYERIYIDLPHRASIHHHLGPDRPPTAADFPFDCDSFPQALYGAQELRKIFVKGAQRRFGMEGVVNHSVTASSRKQNADD